MIYTTTYSTYGCLLDTPQTTRTRLDSGHTHLTPRLDYLHDDAETLLLYAHCYAYEGVRRLDCQLFVESNPTLCRGTHNLKGDYNPHPSHSHHIHQS